MIKIGIYGDSFTADYDGWPRFLKHKMNCDVKTFGIPASSAEYSYMKFLQTHSNYDLVIFFWTSIDRSSLILKNENDEYQIHASIYGGFYPNDGGFYHDEKTVLAQNIKFNEIPLRDREKIKKIERDWIENEFSLMVKYPTKMAIFQESMRDSVKLRRPDCVNIECFTRGIFSEKKIIHGMNNIVQVQKKKVNVFEKNVEESDKIKNHLTIKQNIEFSLYLHKHINEENFDIHTTFSDPEKYYTLEKDLDECGLIPSS